MVGARLLARLARRDSTLIAGRRLSDDPGRAFRAISGLVLAVFVGTVFVGVVGTAISHGRNGFVTMTLPKGTVTEWLDRQEAGSLAPAALGGVRVVAGHATPAVYSSGSSSRRLRGVAGVRQVLPDLRPGPGRRRRPRGHLGRPRGPGVRRRLEPLRRLRAGARATPGDVRHHPADQLLNGDLERRASWTGRPPCLRPTSPATP